MISVGNQTIQDFFDFMNERHRIWMKRELGLPRPWTEDHILLEYKFTNVYRQLDKTTVSFNKNIMSHNDGNFENILFNVIWFRMFGWIDDTSLGFVKTPDEVESFIRKRVSEHKQVFTGAYMSAGAACGGVPKHESYLQSIRAVFNYLPSAIKYIRENKTMRSAFDWLLTVPFIGPFYAYEMACDLRFTPVLDNAEDRNTWGNVGPGAARGLLRLGLRARCDTMVELLSMAPEKFNFYSNPGHSFPFELREIEHTLCEFDKYERVKLGEGRPKERYNGTV